MSLARPIPSLLAFFGILSAACAASSTAHPCIPVSGDRIRGSDLVAAGHPVDPKLDLGPTPLPGVTRAPRPGEPFAGFCFERKTVSLTSDAIQSAIRKALGDRDARIEILEFSHVSAPDSTIEFPLSTLTYPSRPVPDAPILWRGRAVYNLGHSLPIWARVKVTVETSFLEASRDIPPGKVLTESDLAPKTAWIFPSAQPLPSHFADVIGLAATKRIAAGDRIDRKQLIAPNLITPGQTIEIRVLSAGAQLRATAIAERGGRMGETILARNDQSGKRFRAKITGPGQAVVVVAESFQ